MSVAKWLRRLQWIGFVLVVAPVAVGCAASGGTNPCRGTALTITEKVDPTTKAKISCVCIPNACCCGPIGEPCTWN